MLLYMEGVLTANWTTVLAQAGITGSRLPLTCTPRPDSCQCRTRRDRNGKTGHAACRPPCPGASHSSRQPESHSWLHREVREAGDPGWKCWEGPLLAFKYATDVTTASLAASMPTPSPRDNMAQRLTNLHTQPRHSSDKNIGSCHTAHGFFSIHRQLQGGLGRECGVGRPAAT